MKRIVISSLPNMVDIISRNPVLLTLPTFAGLKPLYQSDKKPNCSRCKTKEMVGQYRSLFESSLGTMNSSEQEQMKKLLNVEQVCYYVKNTQQKLELKCF